MTRCSTVSAPSYWRRTSVSDETFDQARERFDEAALVDIGGVLGNSSLLAMCLNTFQVDLPEGVDPPFPDLQARSD